MAHLVKNMERARDKVRTDGDSLTSANSKSRRIASNINGEREQSEGERQIRELPLICTRP